MNGAFINSERNNNKTRRKRDVMSTEITLEQFPKQAQYYAKEQLVRQKQPPLYLDRWLIGVAKKYCIAQGLPYPGGVVVDVSSRSQGCLIGEDITSENQPWRSAYDPTNRNRGLINEYHRAEALQDSPRYTKGTQLDDWWATRLKAEGLPMSLDHNYILQIKIDEIIKHKTSGDPVCENSVYLPTTKSFMPCAFWELSQDPEYLARIKAQWRAISLTKGIV